MKTLVCVGSLLMAAVATTTPIAQGVEQDIVWETSFADAKARAQDEGKGIFHLQLFGHLDQELC
tara:strand:+ start:25811 stop:26002 length:192 start_codon:yes stop_codon:yes gene_type:complete